jgi:hypothetical protein
VVHGEVHVPAVWTSETLPGPGTEEFIKMLADWEAATGAMARAGVLIDCAPLQPPAAATTVRVRDGETLLTDGPAAEIKEHFGGSSATSQRRWSRRTGPWRWPCRKAPRPGWSSWTPSAPTPGSRGGRSCTSRAELLRRLGRRAEAIAAYQTAIALEPPAPERAYLARRMRELT